jgi:RNA polymerase sigma factor (sigma-70 family)
MTCEVTVLMTEKRNSDAHLLDRYTRYRDETAFATLMSRHEPMILGLCTHMLNADSAEDACQETFLILAKKTDLLRQPEKVANWLKGVARRVCLKARTRDAKRRARQTLTADVDRPSPDPGPLDAATEGELVVAWNTELHQIPEPQRSAFILCELEGQSSKGAARLLQCNSSGAVRALVQRCRKRLLDRHAVRCGRHFSKMWVSPTQQNIDRFLAHLVRPSDVALGHDTVACRLVIALNHQFIRGENNRSSTELAEAVLYHSECALGRKQHLTLGEVAGTSWDRTAARFHAWQEGVRCRRTILLEEFVHAVESCTEEFLLKGYTLARVAAAMFLRIGDKAAHDVLLQVGRRYCERYKDPEKVMALCIQSGLLGKLGYLKPDPWIPSCYKAKC